MATTTITIQKGNPYNKILQFYDISVDPKIVYDLTGKTIFFTVKNFDDNGSDDTNAVISKTITSHTNPLAGTSALSLTTTDTNVAAGDYKADFRVYQTTPLVQLNTIRVLCEITDIITKRIV